MAPHVKRQQALKPVINHCFVVVYSCLDGSAHAMLHGREWVSVRWGCPEPSWATFARIVCDYARLTSSHVWMRAFTGLSFRSSTS